MEKVVINDQFKGVNGADCMYKMPGVEEFRYSNNIRDILIQNQLQHFIIPIIGNQSKRVNDEFQIWTFERIYHGTKKTNSFKLLCYVESEYLHQIEADEVEEIHYLEVFHNLDAVTFDELKTYVEYNTLILPEER